MLFLDFSGALPFLGRCDFDLYHRGGLSGAEAAGWTVFTLCRGGTVLADDGIYVLQSLSPLRNLAPCLAATALVGISAWYYQPLLQAGGERPEPDSLLFLAGSILLRWWT